MFLNRKLFAFALFFFLSPLLLNAQSTASSEIDVNLTVIGCNNNSICEANLGEDTLTCPLNCAESTPIPSPTPSSGGGAGSGGTRVLLSLTTISVVQNEMTAVVSWQTNHPSIAAFAWGRQPDFEIGSLTGVKFMESHELKIENLIPGTRYYFKIESRDQYKNILVYVGEFVTTPIPDSSAPANVTNVRTTRDQNEIIITWRNPNDPRFTGVRIVRSIYSYPKDPNDGKVIYEGSNTRALDLDIKPGVTYYYAIFSYNADDIYSSGTVFTSRDTSVTSPVTSTSTSVQSKPIVKPLRFSDFDFIQDGTYASSTTNRVDVYPEKKLIVSIPAIKITGIITEMSLSIDDPSGDIYLIRKNVKGYEYEAQIDPSQLSPGMHQVKILITPVRGSPYELTGYFFIKSEPTGLAGNNLALVILFCILLLLIILAIVWIAITLKKLFYGHTRPF